MHGIFGLGPEKFTREKPNPRVAELCVWYFWFRPKQVCARPSLTTMNFEMCLSP